MIGIIAAINRDRLIGVDGELPWHYSADLKRFKRLTTGHTIIMGRKTWESLPRRPLPNRTNMVLTRKDGFDPGDASVSVFSDLQSALDASSGDVWLIGGVSVFSAGMEIADLIDLTHVPDATPEDGEKVFFPAIDGAVWESTGAHPHEDDRRLRREVFKRRLRA